LGIDVSAAVSASDFTCLKGQGYTFVMCEPDYYFDSALTGNRSVRCWTSLGKPDSNCPATVSAARQAGISIERT
jgi:hypothetical protein